MFSPYFSNHSDLFILKWSTLTMKKHRLHFPKYEIKFLSSQSSANYWHYKSDLNQWILALLVSFQALTQGPEKDSSFLWVFSPDLSASPSHSGRGGFCRAGGQMAMVSEMCLCLTHQMGTSAQQWGLLSIMSSHSGPGEQLWTAFSLQKCYCGPHTHFLVKN